jgi:NTE family protein
LRRILVVTLVLLLLAVPIVMFTESGVHYPVNPPLDRVAFPEGYYLENMGHQGSPEILLVLTFSGGGTRAAALAYGVLEVLRGTTIRVDGKDRSVLDEVDIISAVSGGSFTAAYYGLFGDRLFEDFEEKFLKRPVQKDIWARLLSPGEAARVLFSSHYDRSDVVADYFDGYLFEGRTFADILRRDGPGILINATDVTLGTQFTFDQTQFDLLCSDVLQVPVSRAVTASAAVPILFSSIVFRNYAGRCGYRLPEWLVGALHERNVSSRRFHRARQEMAYLNRSQRPFIHLYDGGLADNLGVRTLLDRIASAGGIWEALRSSGLKNIRKLAVIVVNAQMVPDNRPNLSEKTLPLNYTLKNASSVPLNQYNYETLALLKNMLAEWEDDVELFRCATASLDLQVDQGDCDDIKTYLVEVDFEAVGDTAERYYLQELPTTLDLEAGAVDRLRRAAARIMAESLSFRALTRDLQ